ncbi:MAG: RecX family transcriptional regulator [Bacilli bacterium]|nr:RecX family transcriptional regulator [Bacilli bacterium]
MTKELVLSVRKLKTKYRVETTENKYSFSEETIIKYSIFKGKELEKDELALIEAEENKNSLMNKAINYLSYQARSVNEVRKYLIDKECSLELAEVIIENIQNLGYLDDEALVNSLLDYVMRTRKGPRVLEEKLKQKMLDEDLISSTVRKYDYMKEEMVIEELLDNILPRYRNYPLKKQKLLLYQKLLRDGFSTEIITSNINSIEYIDESDEELEKELTKQINKYEVIDYKIRSQIISKLMNKGYEYSKIIELLNNFE